MRLFDQPNQAEFASDPITSDTPVRTTTRVPPSIGVSYAPSLPSVTIKGLPGGLVWLELGPFPSRDLVPCERALATKNIFLIPKPWSHLLLDLYPSRHKKQGIDMEISHSPLTYRLR